MKSKIYSTGIVSLLCAVILLSASTAFCQAKILFDATHGTLARYDGRTWFQDLQAELTSLGNTVSTTTDIGRANLTQHDIIVISVVTTYHSAYTAGEVNKIRNYVRNGGGLLIMGEMPFYLNDHINPVSEAFGITCGVSELSPRDLTITNIQRLHPIFQHVSEIFFQIAGEVTASSPGTAVAWNRLGASAAVAVAEFGQGRVVVTGDANFCYTDMFGDTRLYDADNRQFIENIFEWLYSGILWRWDTFDFNFGTDQGWTLYGALDEGGHGPFAHGFGYDWMDLVNYPDVPRSGYPATLGDNRGSIKMCTIGGHGVCNPGATWWCMVFTSPLLIISPAWQRAEGFSAKIAHCMEVPDGGYFTPTLELYGNLFVRIYDFDLRRYRYFYSGAAQPFNNWATDPRWIDMSFNWSGMPATRYLITNVYVCIWGEMARPRFEGGLYIDEVAPFEVSLSGSDTPAATLTKSAIDASTKEARSGINEHEAPSIFEIVPNAALDSQVAAELTKELPTRTSLFREFEHVLCMADTPALNKKSDAEKKDSLEKEPLKHSILSESELPTSFKLGQNYPNPFNPETTIAYHLPVSSEVELTVYDIAGREVRRLVRGIQSAGEYDVNWDGCDSVGQKAASGIYLCKIMARATDSSQPLFSEVRMMTLLK
ncbi:T9SS type A sorting domain-containing protein [candidate division KSB1 bacterium]|nr:T9SS type A sorting domain-containing protein [candidate division KSB1 bacterium]